MRRCARRKPRREQPVVHTEDSAQLPRIHEPRGLLAAIVESSEDAIISKALDGTILSWNRGAEQMYGYAAEEIVGQPIARLAPHDRLHEVEEITAALARGEGRRNFQTVRMRKDGRMLHVSLTVSPLRDAGGRIIGGAAISRDVTAQKEAEEALREAKEELEARVKARTADLAAANAALEADIRQREQAELALLRQKALLETILDQATDGMIVCDRGGRFLFVNAAARRVTQGDPAVGSLETLELDWGEAYYPDGRRIPRQEYALTQALAGQAVQGREMRVRRRDGTSLELLVSAVPLRSEGGEPQGAVATFADITPLKHAQSELRVALEEKDVVLREIGHRFKNNLQLLSNLLTLQSLAVASPEARDALEESQRRVHSMAQLHDQLYRSVEPRPVSMREYLGSLTGSLRESYGRAGITLRVEVDDIFLEPERSTPVGLIVSELVTNAFKYAFRAGLTGEIGVEFRRADGRYTLRIRDTGAGIPEWEAPPPSSLGLRLVRLLAQRLRGELVLDTSRGSRFTLSFPADSSAE